MEVIDKLFSFGQRRWRASNLCRSRQRNGNPSDIVLRTALGQWLAEIDASAIIMLTDGRGQFGDALIDAAQRIPFGSRVVFPVAMGRTEKAVDIGIRSVEHPDRLFRRDSLTGKVLLHDNLPNGQTFRLQALHGETIVWKSD